MAGKTVLRNFVDGESAEPTDGRYADLIDPSTGEALDAAFTTASLAAGVYTLALTQADNYLLGFNLFKLHTIFRVSGV
mgnify:CR=1 FL=1